jgi:predicted XRE-type DNA-binding protein
MIENKVCLLNAEEQPSLCDEDRDELRIKAQLALKIAEIIKSQNWSQQCAADILGVSQSRLSRILRGHFRGVSEAKLIDCLVKLGRDVQIVVGKPRKKVSPAKLEVVFQG